MIKVFSENDNIRIQSYIDSLKNFGVKVIKDNTIEAFNREITSLTLDSNTDIKKVANALGKPIIYLPRTPYDEATMYIWDVDENILIDTINDN